MIFAVAIVDARLKNLDLEFADLGTFETAHEFFGFAAEHTAADDFDGARRLAGMHSKELPNLFGVF
jgi:hypothetical protein